MHIDEEERVATFLVFNLSGSVVGYQQYRPDADKMAKNNPREGRYYTYVTKESDKVHYLSAWGLESLSYRNDILFVLEGVFKTVPFHNRGLPAIAALSNNAKPIKNFLYILSKARRIIFVGDNDQGGTTTKSLGYELVLPPSHVKDVDELSNVEFDNWIKEILE